MSVAKLHHFNAASAPVTGKMVDATTATAGSTLAPAPILYYTSTLLKPTKPKTNLANIFLFHSVWVKLL
jgi:hypothetical protein